MKRKLFVRWYHVAPAILAIVLIGAWIAWGSLEKRRQAEEDARVAAEAAAALEPEPDPILPAPDPETAAAIEPCLDLARECRHKLRVAQSDPHALEKLARLEKRLSQALRPVRLFSVVAQKEIQASRTGPIATTPRG